jgi:tRNA G46 methylase TrmB
MFLVFLGGVVMRMRRKPWARPELAACPFYVANPAEKKGCWKSAFLRAENPFWVELAAEKGSSRHLLLLKKPQINLLAIDLKARCWPSPPEMRRFVFHRCRARSTTCC